jgi:adenylate kinase
VVLVRAAVTVRDNEPVRIILLAPPGAGKGTHGERIAERYGVPRISTGDLFRAEVAGSTAVGRRVRRYLERGDLVPDELVVELFSKPVLRTAVDAGGYVLDGFPRTLNQARQAARIGSDTGTSADAVVVLDAPREVLIERLLARGQGRADDNATTIAHRLEIYDSETAPLIDYYAERGILHRVPAVGAIDDVSASIFAVLDPIAGRSHR